MIFEDQSLKNILYEIENVVNSYSMSYTYTLKRTSMALDVTTLKTLADLAKRWSVSKAEVRRQAIRQAKEAADRESNLPQPLQALDWLQEGGGLTVNEAEAFRAEVSAEREAKVHWWEQP